MKTVQVNVRCSTDTADKLKRLAEQRKMTLGELVESLMDCYHRQESDSVNRLDSIEARLDALEQALQARSTAVDRSSLPKVNAAPSDLAGDWKAVAISLYQSGIHSYQAIAEQLSEQGYRNSRGNAYGRREVQRTIEAKRPA
jgi:predicted DNA-binding ribbon-helix-helix protein